MCLPGCLLGVLMTGQMGIQERIEWQAVSMGLKLVLMGMGWEPGKITEQNQAAVHLFVPECRERYSTLTTQQAFCVG